jgi:hypothetical protein
MKDMAATTCRRLEDFFTGLATDGLHYGLKVALVLVTLVSYAGAAENASLAAAVAAQSACTTAPCPIAYVPDPSQVGDLRVPSGLGPHPVAVIIRGGCWLNLFTLALMDDASNALTDAGLAT